jgi:multicomponent Na+:H+ antiporter subunit E
VKGFLGNLLLALAWTAATGQFTVANLLLGFGMGFAALWLVRRTLGPTRYFAKVPQSLRFALFYLWQLLLANLRVAYDIVTPTHYMKPGVIAIPLDTVTDTEITLLANLLTLTPGSLSLDLAPDRKTLYVHVMYIDRGDVEEARRQIKEGLERRVLEVLR